MRSIYLLLMVVPVALVAVLMPACGPAATGASLTREQAARKPTEDAKPLSVPPETAVYYAVEYARTSSPGPGPQLVGDPTEIRGKVMTQEESEQFRPGGQRYWGSREERDLPVWLIAIRGDFQLPGGSNVTYRQGVFVLDARTAQLIGSSHYGAGREVDTSSLLALTLPSRPVPIPFATYTPGPAPTPAPTATPAPPAPSPTRPVPSETGVPAASGGVAVPTVRVAVPGTLTAVKPLVTPPPVGLDAPDTLDRFMAARIQRQEMEVLALLSDGLREALETGQVKANEIDLLQVSNPCWYRYEIEQFNQTTSTTAEAQVRIYEHVWGGDIAGGPPRSWEQDVSLVETPAGWRIDRVSEPRDNREELGEPHGLTISACNKEVAAPTPSADVLSKPYVGQFRLASYRRIDDHVDSMGYHTPVYDVDRDIEVRA